MRTPFKTLWLGALLLGATGCESLLFVEFDAPEICKTEANLTFIGVPPNPLDDQEVQLEFDLPLDGFQELDPGESVTLDARVLLVEITAKDAQQDLSGISAARAELLPAEGSSEAPVTLLRYVRPSNMAASPHIALSTDTPVDLLGLVNADAQRVRLTLAGSLPETDWNADIRACLSARVKSYYLKTLAP